MRPKRPPQKPISYDDLMAVDKALGGAITKMVTPTTPRPANCGYSVKLKAPQGRANQLSNWEPVPAYKFVVPTPEHDEQLLGRLHRQSAPTAPWWRRLWAWLRT